MHAADVQLIPKSEAQLSEQDSLEVVSSEWSQTKSVRRKQKRRGNVKQLNGSDAECAAYSSAQRDAAIHNANSTQNIRDSTHLETGAHAAVNSAGAEGLLGNSASIQRHGDGLMPRTASPLGKNGFGGFRGHAANQAEQQPAPPGWSLGSPKAAGEAPQVAAVQPSARRLEAQDDADALTLVSRLPVAQWLSFTASKQASEPCKYSVHQDIAV